VARAKLGQERSALEKEANHLPQQSQQEHRPDHRGDPHPDL
jgi:hypothetical protein